MEMVSPLGDLNGDGRDLIVGVAWMDQSAGVIHAVGVVRPGRQRPST